MWYSMFVGTYKNHSQLGHGAVLYEGTEETTINQEMAQHVCKHMWKNHIRRTTVM